MTFTSVPVKPDTLRRLRSYKVGGASYDDVLNELMDRQPPEEFWKEYLRRLEQEERVPWDDVRRKAGL